MNNLFWHYINDENDYPQDLKPCFLRIKAPSTWTVGFYSQNKWRTNLYYNLPVTFDDSGGKYENEVQAWAYIPDDWLDQIMYNYCSAFRPNYYSDGRDFCIGIKVPDECSCEGNKRKCNYYD